MLASGEAERIRAEVEADARARVRAAVNLLGQWDITWRPEVPFLWLNLPQGWRGSTFTRACEAEGIQIKPADEFALPDGRAPNAVRIGLNAIREPGRFEAALSRVSALLAAPPVNVDL